MMQLALITIMPVTPRALLAPKTVWVSVTPTVALETLVTAMMMELTRSQYVAVEQKTE